MPAACFGRAALVAWRTVHGESNLNLRVPSLSALALFPILAASAVSTPFARQAEAPQLSISPSFQLKFNGSHNYLLATLVIINASGL